MGWPSGREASVLSVCQLGGHGKQTRQEVISGMISSFHDCSDEIKVVVVCCGRIVASVVF